MTDWVSLTDALWWAVFLFGLVPGIDVPPPSLDRPKKGYWTVGTVFWPLRKTYRDLWPDHAVLERAARFYYFSAAILTAAVSLFTSMAPTLAKTIHPGWYIAETVVAALLIGRSSGFLAADRRLARARREDEAAGQLADPSS